MSTPIGDFKQTSQAEEQDPFGPNGSNGTHEPHVDLRSSGVSMPIESKGNGGERPFPKISNDAFYGAFGDITRLIEPSTESAPVAILAQLLVGFGNVIGRSAFYTVEADDHRANLFANLVGRSAKGRKGTSLNRILRLFRDVDTEWSRERVASGLSSGEGVIWAVRDPIFKPERNKKTGEVEEVKVDNGIDDKRLLVTESEFAQALKVMSRPTNILSMIIRCAWDKGDLRTLVKNDPARATGAHVSIIGHITEEELKRELSQCELFNGFANRFLWIVVQRSQLLPDGGEIRPEVFRAIIDQLRLMVSVARTIGRMKRDDEARALWHKGYEELSKERPGMTGIVTNRSEAQTLRLSMVYALSDGSDTIKADHLRAGLAFWKYCQDSANYLFGDRLSNPNAQRIFNALKACSAGMTRKQILDEVFGRHISAEAFQLAFDVLIQEGLAHSRIEQTGGRSAERWFYGRDAAT